MKYGHASESANRNVCLGDITDEQLENISKEHCYNRGMMCTLNN